MCHVSSRNIRLICLALAWSMFYAIFELILNYPNPLQKIVYIFISIMSFSHSPRINCNLIKLNVKKNNEKLRCFLTIVIIHLSVTVTRSPSWTFSTPIFPTFHLNTIFETIKEVFLTVVKQNLCQSIINFIRWASKKLLKKAFYLANF